MTVSFEKCLTNFRIREIVVLVGKRNADHHFTPNIEHQMITTLSLNPSIACHDEQFDYLTAQFEQLNETLAEDMDQNWTSEQIDAHEPLS